MVKNKYLKILYKKEQVKVIVSKKIHIYIFIIL